MLHFSSTDSAVDIEANFEHKLKKRKRKKQSNLSLNQSRNKRRKFNYGQQVKLCKAGDEAEGMSPDPVGTAANETHTKNSGECTHGLKIHGSSSDTAQNMLDAATGANTLSESEDISVDVDVDVDGSSEESNEYIGPFVHDCIDKCKEFLVEDVIKKFDKEGLLLHFMAFMQMISSGQLSVVNMAVLLAMEMALLLSLVSTTQMRYRNDTSLFWESVLSVGGPRTLRLFSSDKHFGQVNSGQSTKSKYEPSKGHFNFAVPDEKTLRKSKTGLPKVIKCGIIDEALNLVDKKKQFVLSMDGKQLIPGLINKSEGDVNLWGYEGPPTLIENLDCLSREEDIIIDVVGKASIEENSIDKYCKDFKIIVQLIAK